MNVSKRANKRLFRSLLVLMLLLSEPVQAVIKCDRSVLNNYGLSGAEYSTHSSMETCGYVHDRCCSIADEVKITNLWIRRTQPLLDRLTSSYMKLLEDIVDIFWSIATLDPKNVLLQQVINRETPLKEQVCEITSDRASRKEYRDFLNFHDSNYRLKRPWKRVNKSKFFEKGKRHWNVYQNSTYLEGQGVTKKFVKHNKQIYFNKLKRVSNTTNYKLRENRRYRMNQYQRAGLSLNGRLMMRQSPYSRPHGFLGLGGLFGQQNGIFNRGFGFQQNPNGQMPPFGGNQNPNMMNYGRVLSESVRKITKTRKSNQSSNRRGDSFSKKAGKFPTENKSQLRAKSIHRKLRHNSHGRNIFSHLLPFHQMHSQRNHQSSQNQYSNNRNQNSPNYQQNGQNNHNRNPNSNDSRHGNGRGEPTRDQNTEGHREGNRNGTSNNNGTAQSRQGNSTGHSHHSNATAVSQNKTSNCQPKVSIKKRPKRLRMPDWEFSFDANEPLRPDIFKVNQHPFVSKFDCRVSTSNFDKDFLIVNEQKTKFCMKLYEGFLQFDFDVFKNFLKTVKANMNKVHYLKKYFYCTICDAHAISYIDHDKKVMRYEPQFCSTLIKEHLDYLKFMHVVFIEFADSMLQYVQCYESDGTTVSFPFQNFLIKYKRRIPFFQKCFRAVETEGEDFMAACWFICNKFSLLRVSNIFDGDVALLQRIKVALVSFIRKFGKQAKEHLYKQLKRKQKRKPSFDLGLLNNVDGTLVEPVAPAFLISEGKFILNDIDRPKVLGNYTIRGDRIPTPEMEVQVNQFLKTIKLGSIKQLRAIDAWRWHRAHKRFRQRLNSTYEGDIHAYEISPVNKLINQLYNETLATNVSDHMLPQRMLRQKVLNMIKNSGIQVKGMERRLNLDGNNEFDNSDDLLENQIGDGANTGRPRGGVRGPSGKKGKKPNPGNIMVDDGMKEFERAVNSKQPKLKKKKDDIAMDVDEDMTIYKMEHSSEMYEKEKPRTDLYNYGTMIQGEGLNPLKYVNLINFHANVTSLIGKNFKPREKIDRDTMLEYMTNDGKRINRFNEEIDEEIHPAKEVEIRYKAVSNYQNLMDLGELKRRPGLASEAYKKQQKVMTDQRQGLREQEVKDSYVKDSKELQKLKSLEKLNKNHRHHDHIEHKAYNTTFSGISKFFEGIFGS